MKRSFNVKAENGKELPVITVIAKLLEFFKHKFIQEYSKFAKEQGWCPIRRIMWILTVPAIWSLAAKQIMKDAAKKVRRYALNIEFICSSFIIMYSIAQHSGREKFGESGAICQSFTHPIYII